ncbi:substrate-binding periplasmic protein [Bdellovibrio svalbardensis]|uniref:Solute-binding protein family 3/N-terminal domain-containing protein n=1 Tax=Bdellovibrio svalbardensis TaxID=2972972 RepID=A0ABT6DGI4_9BACT|nr:hypothetical protein [Bdellovibrio svalbardensis]MDG0815966.1 hypothetical protein [Bdellovibrio svalbardensis]
MKLLGLPKWLKTSLVILLISECLFCSFSFAAEVRMGFGDKLQPFCLPQSNSGINVQIIREALAYRGHSLVPVFYPMKRISTAFIAKNLDGAMIDSGIDLAPYGGIYAEPAVIYQNVFISLKKRNLRINKPSDLKGLSVIAFPGALERYPEWLQPVNRAGKYIETNDQSLQILTLQHNRFDLALSDRHIYRYFFNETERKTHQALDEVTEHEFTQANWKDYRVVFRNRTVAEDYEVGLKELKRTGRYQAIFNTYLKPR